MLAITVQKSLLVLLALLSEEFLLALSEEASDQLTCLFRALSANKSLNRFLNNWIVVLLSIQHVIAIATLLHHLGIVSRPIGSVNLPRLDLDLLMGPLKLRSLPAGLLDVRVERFH